MNQKDKIALMIDGDNAQPKLITKILVEVSKYGSLTIRRIYGDWTTPQMKSWKDRLNEHAIQPIQQFRYTVGKNATDSAMIIDAMDILHSNTVDAFCLVSSDSDYTRLATRIREEGIFVLGIGKKQTPKPFVNACNVFIYTENLDEDDDENGDGNDKSKRSLASVKKRRSKRREAIPVLTEAFDMSVQDDGWAHLSVIGSALSKIDPGFDPRTYGYKQLSQLMKSLPDVFELKFSDDKGRTIVLVSSKENGD